MNAKTLEAIARHGESLIRAFPNATERRPVALCKKLRRIETAIAPILLENCNVGVEDSKLDAATDKALARVKDLLGLSVESNPGQPQLFVNRDPRGYALKIDDVWVRNYNRNQYTPDGLPIYTDFGGYGIIAPDLTQNERVTA